MTQTPKKITIALLLTLILVQGCKSNSDGDKMSITSKPFGQTPDGKQVDIFTLTNNNGLVAQITNFGGIVTSLSVPDRDGKMADVVLGFDDLDGYVNEHPYFGALIGRVGNRIAKGKFTLEGKEYTLAINNVPNHLHGGLKGYDKVVWNAQTIETADGPSLRLMYVSPDGEEGYPGTLTCGVTYTLTNDNALKIEYDAVTDKATPINLTHHSFWNLAGSAKRDILGHELMLNADHYLPVDSGLIPTGEIKAVKGTPMDFTTSATIGSRIDQVEGGYDHNYVLTRKTHGEELILAAQAYEPDSGRVMEIYTTEPGIQLYSGNFFDGAITGKDGKVYDKYYAFCLETQHFPDSPNQIDFPTTTLKPGQTYTHVCVHKF